MQTGRIALVHEWLGSTAGSERTFAAMAAALPVADLYALYASPEFHQNGLPTIAGRVVNTTSLQSFPRLQRRRELALPLMPLMWQRARNDYHVVVSSSHAFARYFASGREAAHLSYVHTPLRFAWCPEVDGRGGGWPFAGPRTALRMIDRRTVQRTTEFAANSFTVRDRIRNFYDRDARIIYPPVDIKRFAGDRGKREDFLLSFSRFVPYKRHDVAIRVGERLGIRVVVAGSGPDERRLRQVAARSRVPVSLEVHPSDDRVVELLSSASALIFPALEDFGIIPVEAQACGTPVVCLPYGGAAESVIDAVTGVHTDDSSLSAFTEATSRALALDTPRATYRRHVEQFSAERFIGAIQQWVGEYGA